MKPPKFTSQDIDESIPFFRDDWKTEDACKWTAAFVNGETVDRLKAIIKDDSFASGFQTVEQYRNEVLNILNCDDEEMMKKPFKGYARGGPLDGNFVVSESKCIYTVEGPPTIEYEQPYSRIVPADFGLKRFVYRHNGKEWVLE